MVVVPGWSLNFTTRNDNACSAIAERIPRPMGAKVMVR